MCFGGYCTIFFFTYVVCFCLCFASCCMWISLIVRCHFHCIVKLKWNLTKWKRKHPWETGFLRQDSERTGGHCITASPWDCLRVVGKEAGRKGRATVCGTAFLSSSCRAKHERLHWSNHILLRFATTIQSRLRQRKARMNYLAAGLR